MPRLNCSFNIELLISLFFIQIKLYYNVFKNFLAVWGTTIISLNIILGH